MFIIVGLTAIQASNYVPFIPEHKVTENGDFGGWQGIYGVSMIFLAYIDLIQSPNSAEAINPQRTMPRGILGSLARFSIIRRCSFSIGWYVPLF